jgi:hypothetical protein
MRGLQRGKLASATFEKLPPTQWQEGNDELYRFPVGDFRIVYQIRDRELIVLVVRVGHRAPKSGGYRRGGFPKSEIDELPLMTR